VAQHFSAAAIALLLIRLYSFAEKLRNARTTVEERPLQCRVSRMESIRALAPVVVFLLASEFLATF
jgi:hypothetical protein